MPVPQSLSVILPCYNPVSGWMDIVEKNLLLIQTRVPVGELIIVNDGSDKNFDGVEVSQFFRRYGLVKIISYRQNRGKGYALRAGVAESTGALIIYTDIDFPYTAESFFSIFRALQTNSDNLVIGIRHESYYTHLPGVRARISKFLKLLTRNLLQIPTDDTQCGLKGFGSEAKEIFLRTRIDRYLIDLEFIFLAAREKLKIKAVAVELRPDVQLSEMRWQTLMHEGGNFLKIFIQTIF
jgi:glycosyltransferase involved in cell wall biosynthesis